MSQFDHVTVAVMSQGGPENHITPEAPAVNMCGVYNWHFAQPVARHQARDWSRLTCLLLNSQVLSAQKTPPIFPKPWTARVQRAQLWTVPGQTVGITL